MDGRFSKDGHGRWVDAQPTFEKIGHATVAVTLPKNKKDCTTISQFQNKLRFLLVSII